MAKKNPFKIKPKKIPFRVKHRQAIIKASTTAGMFAGGFIGIGGALLTRGVIPATISFVPATLGATIGANTLARKFTRLKKPKKVKAIQNMAKTSKMQRMMA